MSARSKTTTVNQMAVQENGRIYVIADHSVDMRTVLSQLVYPHGSQFPWKA